MRAETILFFFLPCRLCPTRAVSLSKYLHLGRRDEEEEEEELEEEEENGGREGVEEEGEERGE